MKRNWIWSLLVGLILGSVLGVLFSSQFTRRAAPKGTALLREFSLATVAAKIGPAKWEVLEDRIYEPFPSMADFKRIARRIVARAEMSEADLGRFTTQFQQAVTEALEAHSVRNTGQFDLVRDSTRVIDGTPIHSRIDWPRRYYALGDIHGVADIGYVAESGQVTVFVSLIEGR